MLFSGLLIVGGAVYTSVQIYKKRQKNTKQIDAQGKDTKKNHQIVSISQHNKINDTHVYSQQSQQISDNVTQETDIAIKLLL